MNFACGLLNRVIVIKFDLPFKVKILKLASKKPGF